MLERVWTAGVKISWVAGDEVCGADHALHKAIAQSERGYVLAIRSSEEIWTGWFPVEEPFRKTRGRPRLKAHVAPETNRPSSVVNLIESWPESKWEYLVLCHA